MAKHLHLPDFKGIGAVVEWSDNGGATWHPTVFENAGAARGYARSLDEKGRLVVVKRPAMARFEDVLQGKEPDEWTPASGCWPHLGTAAKTI